jgi:hypothetical protein
VLHPSTKAAGGSCGYHLESDFPDESYFRQVGNKFDRFSDVGRSDSPCSHTAVNDLDIECGENNVLNTSVASRGEINEPEGAEYSYAYYEPGPATSHHADRSSRHTYVTRYGTEENIYEEISEVAAKCSQLTEQESLHHHHHQQPYHHRQTHHQPQPSANQSVLEEEVRRVQSRHRRVLGELNLTVEAMLMPPSPRRDEETVNSNSTSSNKGAGPPDLLEDLLLSVGPTDELLSPATCGAGDHDSGFSGSSGTSYGCSGGSCTSYGTGAMSGSSLRRQSGHKDADLPASAVSGAVCSPLLSRRAVKGGAGYLKFMKSQDSAAQQQNKQNQLQQQQQNNHHGFFGRKGWIRLPGFGSSHTTKGKFRV